MFTAEQYATDQPTCLDADMGRGRCEGTVRYWPSLTGTGMPISRCEGHYADRLELQREIDNRYPSSAPADFDPYYAGESWDEDY